MNVFAAGVTIHLVDKVSSGLAQVARLFATTNTAAAALQARLNLIGSTFKSGLILGGAGAALAAPLVAASRSAEDYFHQINQMNSAGFTHKEMVQSIAQAWKTTGSVITSTAVENLRVISDLRAVFGNSQEAVEYMPKFAKIQGAYASALDPKLSKRADELTFAMAKSLDMIGAVKNKDVFDKAANSMFKVVEATGGRITPQDYMTTFKYARQAKFNMSDDFLYKILPELMLENKGGGSGSSGGVGPQLAALYRFGVQGIMNKRAADVIREMGMVPDSAILKTTTTGTTLKKGLLDYSGLSQNPFEWVNKILVPKMVEHFKIDPTNTKALVEQSNQIFKGNQLAATLVAELIMKKNQYTRFAGMIDKTDNIDQAYDRGMKNDPAANWKALHASFENVLTAIGSQVLPVLIPTVNRLATALQQTGRFLHDHPGFTKALVTVTALAAGALILGGTFQILRAGFMAVQFVIGPIVMGLARLAAIGRALTWLPLLGSSLMFVLRFLGPIGLAIGALILVMKNWDNIIKFVNQNSRFFIHIAAEAGRMIDSLGISLKHLGNWAATTGAVIGSVVSEIPLLKELGQQIQISALQAKNNLIRAMKVDDVTAKRDEQYLQKKGLGNLVSAIKGSKPTIPAKNADFHGSKNSHAVQQKNTLNLTIQAPPGTDEKKIADLVKHNVDKHWQTSVKRMQHAQSAASGNSVGRSNQTGGATRP